MCGKKIHFYNFLCLLIKSYKFDQIEIRPKLIEFPFKCFEHDSSKVVKWSIQMVSPTNGQQKCHKKTFTFFLSLSHTFFCPKRCKFCWSFCVVSYGSLPRFCWNRKKYLNSKSLKFPLMSYLKISKNGPKTKVC